MERLTAHPEDERLGVLLRTIRRRSGLTQLEVARQASVPREDIIALEAGRAGELELGRLRRIFAVADARLRVALWWHGAAADRLLDERHAGLVERAVAVYRARGWQCAIEVSFSEWGERGSIDVLAVHPGSRAAVVNEVKASIGSLDETNRTLDLKTRLGAKLAAERFGWRPTSVSRLLIVPNDNTVRRHLDRHAATMHALYPIRGRAVRVWLRHPAGPIAGIWFVSDVASSDTIKRHSRHVAPAVAARGHLAQGGGAAR
jgi:transcriptional regulator with XRE-family HTH domain